MREEANKEKKKDKERIEFELKKICTCELK
jgi:hypothetical protein